MTAADTGRRSNTAPMPIWPVAMLAGSLVTVTLFATLSQLGDRRSESRQPTPSRLTIGFVQKKTAPPPASRVLPAPKLPKRETPPPPKREIAPAGPRESATPAPPAQSTEQRSQPQPAPRPETDRPLEPVPVYRLTGLPRFIHKEKPIYPPHLRRLGREATVKLELLIDAEGTVRSVEVLESAGAAFDRAAIDAIRASSFAPGKVNGSAVPVLMRVPVRFRLR